MQVLKITVNGTDGPTLILSQDQTHDILLSEIDAMFDGGENGDSMVLTLGEMSQEDFNNLKEFEGF